MSEEQVCHCGSLTHSRGECSSVRRCHSCGEVAVNEVGAAIMDERDRYRAALEQIADNPCLSPEGNADIARAALKGDE